MNRKHRSKRKYNKKNRTKKVTRGGGFVAKRRNGKIFTGGATVSGNYCSPSAEGTSSYSCYDQNTLLKIAKKYNENAEEKINTQLSHNELWKEIDRRMSNVCTTERCWSKQFGLNENDHFRPEMPVEWKKDMNIWLSNYDILDVLKQYEKKHDDFLFLGPSPIDFDTRKSNGMCIVNSVCSLDLISLARKKKNRVGIVFNLDKHDGPGSHWVGLFINILDGAIYYYDSYGYAPPPEIFALMSRLSEQGKEIQALHSPLGNVFKNRYNNIRHQFKNSECGVYCLYFITQMLNENDFDKFIENGLNDDAVNRYRTYFFDPTATTA